MMKRLFYVFLLILGARSAASQTAALAPSSAGIVLLPSDIHDVDFDLEIRWLDFTAKGVRYHYPGVLPPTHRAPIDTLLAEWRHASKIVLYADPKTPDLKAVPIVAVSLHYDSLFP